MTQHDAAAVSGTRRFRLIAKLRRPWFLLTAYLLVLSAALGVYAQTMAFVWDEGFHLVAAQMINRGATPYLDFLFPQTLLNAYWNAGVLRWFGNDWHSVHVFDALFVSATVWMAANYIMRRFPVEKWALPCAVTTAGFIGLDTVVVPFGPCAQAYASGMMLTFIAFRVAIKAVDRTSIWLTAVTALLVAAAAGSTLLVAPAVVVFALWIVIVNRAGSRLRKFVAYCLVAVIPFTPEIVLFIRSPRQTLFNVVQYQALFRRVNWGDVGAHDFTTFLDWTVSSQTLLLGLLGLIGLVFLVRKSNWETKLRHELYLAAAVAFATGAFIATAHPTFGRYFIFIIPFVALLAAVGFYYTGSSLIGPGRPFWPTAILLFIMISGITKWLFDDRDATHWQDYEKITAKIREVTPPGDEIMADDLVYFLLRERPPARMEFSYSHKLELPAAQERLYHVISYKELGEQIARGRFHTVETCKDDVEDDLRLNDMFPNQQDFDDCTVYWRNSKSKHAAPAPRPSSSGSPKHKNVSTH